jgi:hypothetical protein
MSIGRQYYMNLARAHVTRAHSSIVSSSPLPYNAMKDSRRKVLNENGCNHGGAAGIRSSSRSSVGSYQGYSSRQDHGHISKRPRLEVCRHVLLLPDITTVCHLVSVSRKSGQHSGNTRQSRLLRRKVDLTTQRVLILGLFHRDRQGDHTSRSAPCW